MKTCIETDFEGLVVCFHAVLGGMERSDRFRIVTVEQKGIGTELNRPVEEQIARQWAFVGDLRPALVTAGGNMEHFDREIGDAWAKLKSGSEAKPWTSGFDRMTRIARSIGAEQSLAEAA